MEKEGSIVVFIKSLRIHNGTSNFLEKMENFVVNSCFENNYRKIILETLFEKLFRGEQLF